MDRRLFIVGIMCGISVGGVVSGAVIDLFHVAPKTVGIFFAALMIPVFAFCVGGSK